MFLVFRALTLCRWWSNWRRSECNFRKAFSLLRSKNDRRTLIGIFFFLLIIIKWNRKYIINATKHFVKSFPFYVKWMEFAFFLPQSMHRLSFQWLRITIFFFSLLFLSKLTIWHSFNKKKKFFINRFDYHINGLDVSAKEITRAKYNAHDGLISLLCQIHCLVTENYCMTFSEPNGSRCVCVCMWSTVFISQKIQKKTNEISFFSPKKIYSVDMRKCSTNWINCFINSS